MTQINIRNEMGMIPSTINGNQTIGGDGISIEITETETIKTLLNKGVMDASLCMLKVGRKQEYFKNVDFDFDFNININLPQLDIPDFVLPPYPNFNFQDVAIKTGYIYFNLTVETFGVQVWRGVILTTVPSWIAVFPSAYVGNDGNTYWGTDVQPNMGTVKNKWIGFYASSGDLLASWGYGDLQLALDLLKYTTIRDAILSDYENWYNHMFDNPSTTYMAELFANMKKVAELYQQYSTDDLIAMGMDTLSQKISDMNNISIDEAKKIIIDKLNNGDLGYAALYTIGVLTVSAGLTSLGGGLGTAFTVLFSLSLFQQFVRSVAHQDIPIISPVAAVLDVSTEALTSFIEGFFNEFLKDFSNGWEEYKAQHGDTLLSFGEYFKNTIWDIGKEIYKDPTTFAKDVSLKFIDSLLAGLSYAYHNTWDLIKDYTDPPSWDDVYNKASESFEKLMNGDEITGDGIKLIGCSYNTSSYDGWMFPKYHLTQVSDIQDPVYPVYKMTPIGNGDMFMTKIDNWKDNLNYMFNYLDPSLYLIINWDESANPKEYTLFSELINDIVNSNLNVPNSPSWFWGNTNTPTLLIGSTIPSYVQMKYFNIFKIKGI